MVDYIRGKKTYTKWDTDADNVDIEYLDGSIKSISGDSWLSGTKGRIIKILLLLLLFSLGLIIGYFVKKGPQDKPENQAEWLPNEFSYDAEHVSAIQKFIQPSTIKEFLKNLSIKPHIAGTLTGSESALVIQSHWEDLGLSGVRVEKYNVLLSYPSHVLPNLVSVVDKHANNILLNFTNMKSDLEIKPFLAYSPSGEVVGRLVYANYGRQEDFQTLQKLNVTVKGAIVLIKNGKGHRGDKVRWAADCEAIGVLLYPDPADYVGKRAVFPAGVGLPEDGIIYGSLKTFPGDPLTPGLPSIDSTPRFPHEKTFTNQPPIPAHSLSYKQAEQLFLLLGGDEAPESWFGGLNLTYRLGPGFLNSDSTVIKMEIHNELQEREISNVIGVLRGHPENDEYVIIGSHHDTWTTGASDPISGTAILMEIVKAFCQLKLTGWSPVRSIVFASWDAEEFGIIGSTEWVEDHFKELVDNAVAYINIDSAVAGNSTLQALGSPLLQKALFDAAKLVMLEDGRGDTVYDQLNFNSVNSSALHPSMGVMGSGSDFVSFMCGYGIPALHIQYVDSDTDSDYPLHHTEYDTYDVITHYLDSSFHASTNLARLLATMVLSLTDFLVLPFSCEDYVVAMKRGLSDLKINYEDYLKRHGIHLDHLEKAINHFSRAAELHTHNFRQNNGSRMASIQQYNNQLMQVERTFILPRGVMNSPFYRHAIFGPHPHDLNRGVTFPGIIDSILRIESGWMAVNRTDNPSEDDIEVVKVQIAEVVNVIRAAEIQIKSLMKTLRVPNVVVLTDHRC